MPPPFLLPRGGKQYKNIYIYGGQASVRTTDAFLQREYIQSKIKSSTIQIFDLRNIHLKVLCDW